MRKSGRLAFEIERGISVGTHIAAQGGNVYSFNGPRNGKENGSEAIEILLGNWHFDSVNVCNSGAGSIRVGADQPGYAG
jgi:hypothetical protein